MKVITSKKELSKLTGIGIMSNEKFIEARIGEYGTVDVVTISKKSRVIFKMTFKKIDEKYTMTDLKSLM